MTRPTHHAPGALVLVLAHMQRGKPVRYEPGVVSSVTPIALRPGCESYRVTVAGRGSAAGLQWDLCPPEWVIPDELEGAAA